MEAMIINTSFEVVKIIDVFQTFIWTERYSSYGDFELHLPATEENLSCLKLDYYIAIKDSQQVMIIENIQIELDVDNEHILTVSGRSLESILDRRIIWRQTIIDGNLQDAIKQLIDDNVIRPSNYERKIDNFVFEYNDDEAITSLVLSGQTQFTGDNLYDVIMILCNQSNIGFRITLSTDNKFKFKLYAGIDRSYKQTKNPYVVFSPTFENLLNSNYLESKQNLKNVTLVHGAGEGLERKGVCVGNETGFNRRELYTDARDIPLEGSTVENESLHLELLSERGKEKLTEYVATQSFECGTDPNTTFKYGEDYFIGDVVQVINEYGMESEARVTELIRSEDLSGSKVYPTFTNFN